MYLIRRPDREDDNSIKDTLQSLAKSMKMPISTSTHEIFDHWESVVGDELASQSKPLSIRDSTLVLAAANPVVARELKMNGPSIINIINVFLKMQVVDRLEVKTGPNYARRFRRSG